MSPRNFARVYAEKRGRTPAKAVESLRVDAARRKLEESDDRIEAIAPACGFSNEEQMRRAFIRVLSIPPREYRKRFASTQNLVHNSIGMDTTIESSGRILAFVEPIRDQLHGRGRLLLHDPMAGACDYCRRYIGRDESNQLGHCLAVGFFGTDRQHG